MQKKSVNLIGVALLLTAAALLFFGWLRSMPAGWASGGEARRVFTIELPKDRFPALERPAVEFDHELHTGEMKEEGCTACHDENEDGNLTYKIYEASPKDTKETIMDAYHNKCTACHEERAEGPVACGECHLMIKRYESAPWGSVELDMRRHNKHVVFKDNKCDACHHDYNEETKELEYVEGAESSCRDCHRSEAVGDTPPLRSVAHARCVNCHMKESAAGNAAGPIECAGCHGEREAVPAVTDMSDVQRLDRGQKDMPLILVDDNQMEAVPFDHANHEKNTRNCRVCHHESLKACNSCHTLDGGEDGGGVKLSDAYHRATSDHSCVGCHETQKKKQECVVCHISMQPGPYDASCDTCHSGSLPPEMTGRMPVDPASLLPADLPEDFSIGVLKDRFQPVEFPHREIINKLNTLIGDDRLANIFHGNRRAVCTACHHHSPLGEQPPTCARCHQDPFDAKELMKPGLKGAFHRQCVGCHKTMEVGDYRDCSVCHKDSVPMPGKPEAGREEGAGTEGGGQ